MTTTLTITVSNNRAMIEVEPVPCGGTPQGNTSKALIDTGATNTCLHGQVFRTAAIKPGRARITMTTADGGKEKRKLFPCDLYLSDGKSTVALKGVSVVGLDPDSEEEVIVGMDTLLLCEMNLDGPSGVMTLEFP